MNVGAFRLANCAKTIIYKNYKLHKFVEGLLTLVV